MNEKSENPIYEAQMAAKRAALDRVLAAAKAERTDLISLYDCAIWLLYACFRSDAIGSAREFLEEEKEEHTICDEIVDAIDLAFDDQDSASSHETDAKNLGEQLDPDFGKPAHALTDWLDQA